MGILDYPLLCSDKFKSFDHMKLLAKSEVDKNSCKFLFFPWAWHKHQEDLVAPSSPINKQTEQIFYVLFIR